jgi:hypothetical protein
MCKECYINVHERLGQNCKKNCTIHPSNEDLIAYVLCEDVPMHLMRVCMHKFLYPVNIPFTVTLPTNNIWMCEHEKHLDLWPLIWGTPTPRGMRKRRRGYVKTSYRYVKFKKKKCDKSWITRARFRVNHRRPGHQDIRFGRAISLSCSFIKFYILLFNTLFWM